MRQRNELRKYLFIDTFSNKLCIPFVYDFSRLIYRIFLYDGTFVDVHLIGDRFIRDNYGMKYYVNYMYNYEINQVEKFKHIKSNIKRIKEFERIMSRVNREHL